MTNDYNFLVLVQYIEMFPTVLCFGNCKAKSSLKYWEKKKNPNHTTIAFLRLLSGRLEVEVRALERRQWGETCAYRAGWGERNGYTWTTGASWVLPLRMSEPPRDHSSMLKLSQKVLDASTLCEQFQDQSRPFPMKSAIEPDLRWELG